MQIVIGGRGTGKSTIVRNAFNREREAGKNVFFVTPSRHASMLRDIIPSTQRAVFSYAECQDGALRGRKLDGVYVDDAELVLGLALGGRIEIASMSIDEPAIFLPGLSRA